MVSFKRGGTIGMHALRSWFPRRVFAAAAAGALVLLAACTTGAPSGGAAPAPAKPTTGAAGARVETVRQGIVSVVSDAGFLLGIDRGYFRGAGIGIEGTR